MPKPASRSKRTPSTTWANSLDRSPTAFVKELPYRSSFILLAGLRGRTPPCARGPSRAGPLCGPVRRSQSPSSAPAALQGAFRAVRGADCKFSKIAQRRNGGRRPFSVVKCNERSIYGIDRIRVHESLSCLFGKLAICDTISSNASFRARRAACGTRPGWRNVAAGGRAGGPLARRCSCTAVYRRCCDLIAAFAVCAAAFPLATAAACHRHCGLRAATFALSAAATSHRRFDLSLLLRLIAATAIHLARQRSIYLRCLPRGVRWRL